jgi:hypothetical protein
VAAYSHERSGSSHDCANAMGSAVPSISKMRSHLSMRGMIRRCWRLREPRPWSARRPPEPSAPSRLSQAGLDARKVTGRATRSRPSPSRHCRSRAAGQARRCGGRTTPAPTRRCWRSSCRGCRAPCVSPAPRSSHRRHAPRGGSVDG